MKIDLYTKCILTVIAGALLWLGFGENVSRPVAAQGPVRVIIDGVSGSQPMPVTLIGGTKYNSLHVDADNPLAVKVVDR